MKVFICTIDYYGAIFIIMAKSTEDAMIKFIKSPTAIDAYYIHKITPNIEEWERVGDNKWRSKYTGLEVDVKETIIPDGDCLFLGELAVAW